MSDVAAIEAALAAQEIETPSWAYGSQSHQQSGRRSPSC
jgi:hypothetical protein